MSPYLLSLIGGACIGVSAAMLHVGLRRTAGISGILGGLVGGDGGDVPFRVAFLGSMLLVGIAVGASRPDVLGTVAAAPSTIVIGGLLVGFGTRLGNGCTSGHGVCGISKRSPRSIGSTLTFLAAGMVTVAVVRAVTS